MEVVFSTLEMPRKKVEGWSDYQVLWLYSRRAMKVKGHIEALLQWSESRTGNRSVTEDIANLRLLWTKTLLTYDLVTFFSMNPFYK